MEIAKRFMARFRPEWASIVEENQQRAQRQVELGIAGHERVTPWRAEFGILAMSDQR